MSITLKEVKGLLAEISESSDGSPEYYQSLEKLLHPEILGVIVNENSRLVKSNERKSVSHYDILTDFFVCIFCYPDHENGRAMMPHRSFLPNKEHYHLISSVYGLLSELTIAERDEIFLYASERKIKNWLDENIQQQ